jgi:hypothetical protein
MRNLINKNIIMKNGNYEYDDYDDDIGYFVWMGIVLLFCIALMGIVLLFCIALILYLTI